MEGREVILQDFSEWLDENDIIKVDVSVIRDYVAGLYYELVDECDDLEEVSEQEQYIENILIEEYNI